MNNSSANNGIKINSDEHNCAYFQICPKKCIAWPIIFNGFQKFESRMTGNLTSLSDGSSLNTDEVLIDFSGKVQSINLCYQLPKGYQFRENAPISVDRNKASITFNAALNENHDVLNLQINHIGAPPVNSQYTYLDIQLVCKTEGNPLVHYFSQDPKIGVKGPQT